MQSIHLKLTLRSDVIQSAYTRTEGAHSSLNYIRGSSLLGAAAKALYEGMTEEDAFCVFHSGAVRFCDARPLDDGSVAYPVPGAWLQKEKQRPDTLSELHVLTTATAKKKLFGCKGEYFSRYGFWAIDQSFRMKTAIDRDQRGRPLKAALFGYEALRAGSIWQARIDLSDDVSPEILQKLTKAFDGRVHWIGRSRGAEYGQVEFQVEAAPVEAMEQGSLLGEHVRFYAASDIALFSEDDGQPTVVPTPAQFGLDEGGFEYDSSCSAIRTAQFSPYNAKRRSSDLQRNVIQRGSVIAFGINESARAPDLANLTAQLSGGVGGYRSEGLGEVLVQPWFLSEETVRAEIKREPPEKNSAPNKAPDSALAGWMSNQRDERDLLSREHDAGIALAEKFSGSISTTQWNRLARLCAVELRQGDPGGIHLLDSLEKNLFDPETAGVTANKWMNGARDSIIDALKQEALDAGDDRLKQRAPVVRLYIAAHEKARRTREVRRTRAGEAEEAKV